MANLVMIAGNSGQGKSTSMRNLNWDETFVIKPNNKPFPFRTKGITKWDPEAKVGHYIETTDYGIIKAVLQKLPEYGKKIIVIEDTTHLLLKFNMDRVNEKGFDKFANAAAEYYQLLEVAQSLPEDVIVYFITHIDEDQNGNDIVKVIGGKFISEKIDPASLVTIALKAIKTNDGYKFRTQAQGDDFYKSPMGMFEDELIDNDLKDVTAKIRDYYAN